MFTSMTLVVEYQYWVYKIRTFFCLKVTRLKKEFFIFLDMEEKLLNLDFPDHYAASKIERILDAQHGERGRLTYDCSPKWWLGGFCLKND